MHVNAKWKLDVIVFIDNYYVCFWAVVSSRISGQRRWEICEWETVRRVFVVQLNYAATVSVLRPITSRVRAPRSWEFNQWLVARQRLAQQQTNQRRACKWGICFGWIWMSTSQRWSLTLDGREAARLYICSFISLNRAIRF